MNSTVKLIHINHCKFLLSADEDERANVLSKQYNQSLTRNRQHRKVKDV